MATYISTLEDKNGDGVLPRTALKAICDDNGSYLDNALEASDINALKNGKVAAMDSEISSLSSDLGTADLIWATPQTLAIGNYGFGDYNPFDYKKLVFLFKYNSNGTHWTFTMYPEFDAGFHLYSAYGATVHDAYGSLQQTYFQIDGKLGADFPYLVNVIGFKTY